MEAVRLKLTLLFLHPTGIKTFHFDALNKSLARAVTIGQAARVNLMHTNELQHVAQSGAQVYTWQKPELFADAQVHQESMEECKSFVKKVIEATDDRFPNRNQLTDLDIFDPTAVPGTEEALADYGTEELKRLHEYFSQTKFLVWDTTRLQPKPLDRTALGLCL